jgi:hypothetical protein
VTQRILRGAPATLTYEHLDADGEALDATGALTVGVTRADGTVVLAPGTATVKPGGSTGRYTVALTAAQTAQLDLLTATWSDAAAPTAARTTVHAVVGAFMFSVAELRAFEKGFDDVAEYPSPKLIAARNHAEDEVERICDRVFVPRYRRVVLDGTGEDTVLTGCSEIRTVRSVREYASTGSATYTTFTASQLAGLVPTPDGALRRTDGRVFDFGFGTVVVELEHGLTVWGDDLRDAVMTRAADRARRFDSQIPERAARYTGADGFSFDLTIPDEFSTGIPAVDAVYGSPRYSRRNQGGDRSAPASRTLSYDPQFFGLYRGGKQ